MFREKFSSDSFGLVLIGLIALLGTLTFWRALSDQTGGVTFAAGASLTVSSTLTLTNAAPLVNSVTINNGVSMTLIGNATTAIDVNAQIFDVNGCADINNGTATIMLYRSSITSSTCLTAQNNLNCYLATAFTATSSCAAGDTAINTTTTFGVYYFAQATDASSSFTADTWKATVNVRDSVFATGTRDSAGVELNTLLATNITTSSVNYGSMTPSSTTGQVNRTISVQNTGNASSSIGVSGTALTLGSNVIATSSQHYASSTFNFGGNEGVLSDTATTISGITLLPRVSLVNDLNSWGTTTALPSVLEFFPAVVYRNYLYTLGGNITGGTNTSTVFYAPITSSDGSVGSWATTTQFPTTIAFNSAIAYNGYLYNIGGSDPAGTTSSVYYAYVNATGSIGSWLNTTALPYVIRNNVAVENNGYVYVLGGRDDAEVTSTVLFAPINSDGTISSWTKTTALPNKVYDHGAAVYNSFVYIVGGRDPSSTSTVRYAPLNSDGSVGSWVTTTALPNTLRSHRSIAYRGYLYVIGGTVPGGSTSTVRYASINSDGSIGSWVTTETLPSDVSDYGAAVYNGFIYSIGGILGGSVSSTVLFSKINNGLSQRDTFWGLTVPTGVTTGTYNGVNTFTASYVP